MSEWTDNQVVAIAKRVATEAAVAALHDRPIDDERLAWANAVLSDQPRDPQRDVLEVATDAAIGAGEGVETLRCASPVARAFSAEVAA